MTRYRRAQGDLDQPAFLAQLCAAAALGAGAYLFVVLAFSLGAA